MYFVALSVLVYLSTCHCLVENDNCGFLKWLDTTSVSVEIIKKGFHRDLVTTVQLQLDGLTHVKVLLIHNWPRGVYIDPYQLASLSDQHNWQILLDSTIDLEAPAHKSSGFVTYLYPIMDGPTSKWQNITIPMHGRYQKPSFGGSGFTSVDIELPQLLLRNEKCTQLNKLEPHTVMDAPCTADNSTTCAWVKIQNQKGHGRVSLQFPVGDGSFATPVCGGTLLVTLICCVALSKYAWKHQITNGPHI